MTSETEAPRPHPASTDNSLRLLIPDWIKDNRVTAAAFKTRGRESPSFVPVSMFIKERLPDTSGACLHVDRFANHGRARLGLGHLRDVQYLSDRGETVPCNFDISMAPNDCGPPLEHCRAAHGNLIGPTHRSAAASALAARMNADGQIEKFPNEATRL